MFESWAGQMWVDTRSSQRFCVVVSYPINPGTKGELLLISTHGHLVFNDGRSYPLDLGIGLSPNTTIKIDNNKRHAVSQGLAENRKGLIQEFMNGNQAVVIWLKSSKMHKSTYSLNGFTEAYKTARGWCDSWARNVKDKITTPKSTSNSNASNSISYKELDAQVGCKSKYSDAKKEDIFNARYKNRWMTWRGEVVRADSDEASLNMDGKGIQDLHIDFADKNAGYDLTIGQFITVRFLMKSAGGCFLPYRGYDATILR